MIEGVLDLEKTKVDQILQPRVDLVAVEAKSSLAELLEKARGEKYSRIPVYNETVDHIIGIVFTRDLIEYTDRPASELKEAKVGLAPTGGLARQFKPTWHPSWACSA